ncbi:MAG TPA: M50 family metallopeptidase [Acidimicrobiales bacterium]|nr:M50 family metallopeptidase [Acidimicrobiales bacterium]
MTQAHDIPPPDPPPDPPAAAPSEAVHGDEGWRKLVPLLAAVGLAVVLSLATGSFPVFAFVLAVIAMIMIHEAGHFVTAKWSGMKVTEFFLGFGPRLWSFRKGETEYGVKAIPAGGYVKIIGMSNLERNIDPADEPRTYRQQPYGRRLLVVSAGIVTHFVVALLVMTLLWTVVGVPNGDRLAVEQLSRLETGESPALDAGFRVGDRILSYDGIAVEDQADVPAYIRARPGQPITFVVARDGRRHTLVATPAAVTAEGQTIGRIGVDLGPQLETVNPAVGVARAGRDVGELTWASVRALGSFFAPSSLRNYADMITGKPVDDESAEEARPVSIVGVGRIAGQAAETGLFNVLSLFVILNVFVGVFNMVPMLPFDGGHIAIATYERIRSRRGRRYHADVSKLMPIAAAVLAVLLVLGVTSIWLDIFQPPDNPFQ